MDLSNFYFCDTLCILEFRSDREEPHSVLTISDASHDNDILTMGLDDGDSVSLVQNVLSSASGHDIPVPHSTQELIDERAGPMQMTRYEQTGISLEQLSQGKLYV